MKDKALIFRSFSKLLSGLLENLETVKTEDENFIKFNFLFFLIIFLIFCRSLFFQITIITCKKL